MERYRYIEYEIFGGGTKKARDGMNLVYFPKLKCVRSNWKKMASLSLACELAWW